ncbi:Uncharacterised protein [uncultured archaeon]|nr:Uncharacterised protein [uncultured archaeon]
MLVSLGLMAIAGFCAKIVDEIAERKLNVGVALPLLLAMLYGLSLGWLASQTLLGPLLLALAAASMLAGKIDHPYHLLGAVCFAAMFAFLPLLTFEPWLFALFLLSGLLDELNIGRPASGTLALLNTERLWTPLAALSAWLFLGATPLFILAIVCFDIAYRFGRWCVELRYPIRGQARTPAKANARKRK